MSHTRPTRRPARALWAGAAAMAALWGCAQPLPTPAPVAPVTPVAAAAPTTPVTAAAIDTTVSLGLGQREFYMTINRKGGAVKEADSPRLRCLSFSYEVKAPRDVATGQSSGKRQHAPIVIRKEWGAATPQLMQAMGTGEVIPSVLLEFPRNGLGDGARGLEVFSTVELTNVTVVGIQQATGDLVSKALCPSGDCVSPRELEEISLVCQKATFTDVGSKTMAVDDWLTR